MKFAGPPTRPSNSAVGLDARISSAVLRAKIVTRGNCELGRTDLGHELPDIPTRFRASYGRTLSGEGRSGCRIGPMHRSFGMSDILCRACSTFARSSVIVLGNPAAPLRHMTKPQAFAGLIASA